MKKVLVLILSFLICPIICSADTGDLRCENNQYRFSYSPRTKIAEIYEISVAGFKFVEFAKFVKQTHGTGEMGDYHDVIYLDGAHFSGFQIINHSFVEAFIDNKRIEDLECHSVW